jgi:hypothetical protein
LVAILTAIAVGGCRTAPEVPDGPRAALDAFLEYYFHTYRTGLPDAAERAALAPKASPAFNAALEQAAAAERCAQARHKGTEPPLIQGDLFSSLFEKATAVAFFAVAREEPAQIDYTVAFEYRTPGAERPEVQWQDTVRLVRIDDAWLVDDVIHGGNWDFSAKGSVKTQLLAVAALCTAR